MIKKICIVVMSVTTLLLTGCYPDGEMYTLHESGYAKQFYVYGEYIHEYK